MTYTALTPVQVLERRLGAIANEILWARENLQSAQRSAAKNDANIRALRTEELAIRQAISKLQAGDA